MSILSSVNIMDMSWLHYSPVIFMSCAATILCSYVFSPLVLKSIAPNKKFGEKTVYLCTFITSTVHAITSCTSAVIALAQGDLHTDRTYGVNSAGVIALHISVGYSIGDTLVSLVDPYLRGNYAAILHHVAMTFGILLSLYHDLFFFFLICRFFTEFSTPFVNLRGFLHEIGKRRGKMYVAASVSMTISFFLCRVLAIPWLTYALFTELVSTTVPLHLKVIMALNSAVFDILNLFWFYKIVRGAIKFFSSKRRN